MNNFKLHLPPKPITNTIAKICIVIGIISGASMYIRDCVESLNAALIGIAILALMGSLGVLWIWRLDKKKSETNP